MRKFIAGLAVLSLMVGGNMPVFANRNLDSFTVEVPTYAVTEAARLDIHKAGILYIHHIVISNNDAAVGQSISFYELGEDTNTVNLKYRVYTGSGSIPIQTSFPIPESPWEIDDLVIRKSSTGSTVQVTIFYR